MHTPIVAPATTSNREALSSLPLPDNPPKRCLPIKCRLSVFFMNYLIKFPARFTCGMLRFHHSRSACHH